MYCRWLPALSASVLPRFNREITGLPCASVLGWLVVSSSKSNLQGSQCQLYRSPPIRHFVCNLTHHHSLHPSLSMQWLYFFLCEEIAHFKRTADHRSLRGYRFCGSCRDNFCCGMICSQWRQVGLACRNNDTNRSLVSLSTSLLNTCSPLSKRVGFISRASMLLLTSSAIITSIPLLLTFFLIPLGCAGLLIVTTNNADKSNQYEFGEIARGL